MCCDLDLRYITLGTVHDTPLGDRQQFCEILSRSNMIVRSYDPDTYLRFVCTATMALEI